MALIIDRRAGGINRNVEGKPCIEPGMTGRSQGNSDVTCRCNLRRDIEDYGVLQQRDGRQAPLGQNRPSGRSGPFLWAGPVERLCDQRCPAVLRNKAQSGLTDTSRRTALKHLIDVEIVIIALDPVRALHQQADMVRGAPDAAMVRVVRRLFGGHDMTRRRPDRMQAGAQWAAREAAKRRAIMHQYVAPATGEGPFRQGDVQRR